MRTPHPATASRLDPDVGVVESLEHVPDLRVVYSSHGTVPFSPDLIIAMERAMVKVMGGRKAERQAYGGQYHDFGPFGIIVPNS